MEGSNDEQPPPQERELPPAPAIAVKPPTAAPRRSTWNPLATPKRALLSVLVLVVLSAGVFVGVLKLQVPIGHVKWSRTIGPMWHSTPMVSNGIVYVGTSDNRVWALDAASGHIIWTVPFDTGNEGSGITPAPVVSDGVVYVNSQDAFIYALDAHSGSILWSYEAVSMGAPVIANGIVYVGTEDGVLLALDAISGRLLWSQRSEEHYDFLLTSPVVAQGMVYINSNDGIIALDAASGQKRWERFTSRADYTPTVANGVLYLTTNNEELDALDATSGQVKWQVYEDKGFTSSPVVAGNMVYIYSFVGMFAVDRASGKDRWFHKINGMSATPTVINNTIYVMAGDRNWKPGLDFGPDNNELDVLSATTGSDLWYYPLSGIDTSTPAVNNGVAYVGGYAGTLYALLPPA